VNFQEVVHSDLAGNADVAKPQWFAENRMDTHKNARLTRKVEWKWFELSWAGARQGCRRGPLNLNRESTLVL